MENRTKKEKVKFALFFGNRGFFPRKMILDAIKVIEENSKKAIEIFSMRNSLI